MAYYDQLIAVWPTVTGNSVSNATLAAAQTAFQVAAPVMPELTGSVTTDNNNRQTYINATQAWRWSWASIFFDPLTVAKINTLNATFLPGPLLDIETTAIMSELLLSGAYLTLQAFSQESPTSNVVHDTALNVAKTLMIMLTDPNAPRTIACSNATTYAQVTGMLNALAAMETASAGSTGITSTIQNALLALPATNEPWWKMPVSANGGGLVGPVSSSDLEAVMHQSNGSVWLI